MKVKELAEWLLAFHDQDAEVQVVDHFSGTGYYDQGGNAYQEFFNTDLHTEYTNFVGNKFVKDTEPHYNKSYLLLGRINA